MGEFGTLNFSVGFKKTSAFPLDVDSYFTSLEKAQQAASTAVEPGSADSVYYIGQTLTVVEGENSRQYIIQPDKTLKSVISEDVYINNTPPTDGDYKLFVDTDEEDPNVVEIYTKTETDSKLNLKQDVITNVQVSVDNNVGVPSGIVTVNKSNISFAFKNLKGEKGDAFTYSDFTPEQIQGLQKPATDAAAIANQAAESANTAAENATAKGNEAVQIATDKGNEATQIAITKGEEAIQTANEASQQAIENSKMQWRPSVDSNGNLTWSRNSSETAPASVNIKGPQGNSGASGSTDNIVVINDLNGGESTAEQLKVLSAEQGRILNEKISDISNYRILEWSTDIATTRKQILQQERKTLLQISYENSDGDIINEQYIGTTFTDIEWEKDANWEKIANQKQLFEIDKETKEYFKIHEYDYTTFWKGDSTADKVVNNKTVMNDLKDCTHLSLSFYNQVGGGNRICVAFYDENFSNLSNYNRYGNEFLLAENGCWIGIIERPIEAKYVVIWTYNANNYIQYEYIKLLKLDSINSLYLDNINFKENYSKKEEVDNLNLQTQIIGGTYQNISSPDIVSNEIWKYKGIINLSGIYEEGASGNVSDFIDVTNIENLGFCLINKNNTISIAAYADKSEDTFIESNSIGNISNYSGKLICGIWNRNEGTNYIRLYAQQENVGGFSIYNSRNSCYVSYNTVLLGDGSFTWTGFKHKGYVAPYYNNGIYIDYELDANSTVEGQVYYKIYLFSKDFKHISKSELAITNQNYFDSDYITRYLVDGYDTNDVAYILVQGALSKIKIYTDEIDIKLKRNIFSSFDKDLSTRYSEKLNEAENIKIQNIEPNFNFEFKDAVIVKIQNQNDLDNILFEHQEDGTRKEGNIKSGLYKIVEENYSTTKNYIVEFYNGTYLLSDANYEHGLCFYNNIFSYYPNINIIFRNALGNDSVILLSDGLQYTLSDNQVIINKRHADTGLRESFTEDIIAYTDSHYIIEYKNDNPYFSKFVDENFDEVEISSLKDLTVDACIEDYSYTWSDNVGKFKLPEDISWLSCTEEECEFTFCTFRRTDGYTESTGNVIKIEDGYVYVSSPTNTAPYLRVKIFNLPIIQENKITVKRVNDKILIYIPNAIKKLYECTHQSGMLFIGMNTYKPNSIIINGLKFYGSCKRTFSRNPRIQYQGYGFIADGGCNIKISNNRFKNIGTVGILIRDTDTNMKTKYALINKNQYYNVSDACIYCYQLMEGIASVYNNSFELCGLDAKGMEGGIINVFADIATYIYKNNILNSSSKFQIQGRSDKGIVIIEDNYSRNTPIFIANHKKAFMMSDMGSIYVPNISKAIIRYNYIDGFFGHWTCRIIYCDDGPFNKTIYGNMILNSDIVDDDSTTCGAIAFNSAGVEELRNTNNVIINNIITRRYVFSDAKNLELPCFAGKNLLVGIGAGQVCGNTTIQNIEEDIIDKQAIIQDGELYTELDISKMFIRGEAAKHIHRWKNIYK